MSGLLYHFSEDPAIPRFVPQVSQSSGVRDPLVWAIDPAHADLYLFPRDCPRVTFHATPETSLEDRTRFLGLTTARRVSAIEATWLQAMRETHLYRYVLSGDEFELRDANAGYWVSRRPVEPLRVEPVGDLLAALVDADVELRVMPSLWSLYEAVIASSLGFSIIRWRNVAPRPEQPITSP